MSNGGDEITFEQVILKHSTYMLINLAVTNNGMVVY